MVTPTDVNNPLLSACCTVAGSCELLFLCNNTPVKIDLILAGGEGPDDKLGD